MTVGVKYCGGCNPKYERGVEVNKIKERYPDCKFEGFDLNKKYDKVLLICGCERVCLGFRPELVNENSIVVGSADDCEKVKL